MYQSHWTEMWTFSTARFIVIGEVTDCQEAPEDSLCFPEDIAYARSGGVAAWFNARVRVCLLDEYGDAGETIGSDTLGGCSYQHETDVFRNHARHTAEANRLRRAHRYNLADARYARSGQYGRGSVAQNLESAALHRRELAEVLKVLRNNAALNPPVTYCEYGPAMVRTAIAEAREYLAKTAEIANTMRA